MRRVCLSVYLSVSVCFCRRAPHDGAAPARLQAQADRARGTLVMTWRIRIATLNHEDVTVVCRRDRARARGGRRRRRDGDRARARGKRVPPRAQPLGQRTLPLGLAGVWPLLVVDDERDFLRDTTLLLNVTGPLLAVVQRERDSTYVTRHLCDRQPARHRDRAHARVPARAQRRAARAPGASGSCRVVSVSLWCRGGTARGPGASGRGGVSRVTSVS